MVEERNDEETTEVSDESTDSTSSTNVEPEETSTSNSSEDEPEASQENEASNDLGLSDEEKQRRDELLGDSEKELRDARSAFGRKEKEYQQRLAEQQGIIKGLTTIAEQNGNGTATTTETDDPDSINFHTPSGNFLNEDGTLNDETLSEWNLLSTQKIYQRLLKAEKEVERLGGDVSGIQETETNTQKANAFQARYGLSREVYDNYERIKTEKGEFDAMEYVELERKEKAGIDAARAHRDTQRAPNVISSDTAATVVSAEDSATVAQNVAKEILDTPRGDNRNALLYAVPSKYPAEISSRILRLVAEGS